MYSKKRRESNYHHPRRSSLQVNLSFTSDVSDASEETSELVAINSKQQIQDDNVQQLREAILNKTKEIFDYQNNFCQKTINILAGLGASSDQNDQNVTNSQDNKKNKQNKGSVIRDMNSRNCTQTISSPILSASKANNNNNAISVLSSETSVSSNDKDSTALGNPVTSSTFITNNNTLPVQIVETQTPITNSSNKPVIRSIRSCYISLERIDGYNRSRNLKSISMELTPVQKRSISRYRKDKRLMRSSLEVRTSLDQLSNQLSSSSTSAPSKLSSKTEEAKDLTKMDKLSLIVNTSRISGDNSTNSSIVAATPCPIIRSTLLRTTRSRLAKEVEEKKTTDSAGTMNKLCHTVEVESMAILPLNKLDDTIVLDTSCSRTGPIIEDSSDEQESRIGELDNDLAKRTIMDDLWDDEMCCSESNNRSIEKKTIKQKKKRKLFTQLDDSMTSLISLTPIKCIEPSSSKPIEEESKMRIVKERRTKRRTLLLKRPIERKDVRKSERQKNYKVRFPKTLEDNKNSKQTKKRKVISKKIIVKKRVSSDVLKALIQTEEDCEGRDSLNDFTDSKRLVTKSRYHNKSIYIVTTGLCNGDKDLVKDAVKNIGGAKIEDSVTRHTTHIITTGVRTINLLRGIIRGCWLLSLAWIKDSIKARNWLKVENYEIDHFSKAVKENRKDREIFGRSYVPELFATCGLIYIDVSTSPSREILKELVKTAGGRTIEDVDKAKILIGGERGLREVWILDSITTGQLQPIDEYRWVHLHTKECK